MTGNNGLGKYTELSKLIHTLKINLFFKGYFLKTFGEYFNKTYR